MIVKQWDGFIILKQQSLMIAAQLPSLQEIYDYSSPDLQKIIDEITIKTSKSHITREEQLKYDEYIENIRIQLQERKTLEFFQELCAVDNPYIKQVTEFNNQFLKLAQEAIAAQEHTKNPFKKKQLQEISEEQQENQHEFDGRSTTSAIPHKSRLADNRSYESTNGYEDKAYTVTSEKRSAGQYEKRTNFGVIKTKQKNHMKDFIMSTLNKNKAEGCYVVKKSGPAKPQPAFTVNERGHVVSANTLEPISMKSIKSSSTAKEKPQPASNNASNKQIVQSSNKINEKDLDKKRLEAIDKVKHVKAEKKKQKTFNNNDLLEMVRQQERQKQRKEKKKQEEKISNNSMKNDSQKENKSKIELSKKQAVVVTEQIKIEKTVEETNALNKTQHGEQKAEQIRQVIEVEQDNKPIHSHSSLQQIKEQIKPEQTLVFDKNVTGQKKSIVNPNVQIAKQQKEINRQIMEIQQKKKYVIRRQQEKQKELITIAAKEANQIQGKTILEQNYDSIPTPKQNQFLAQLDELSKMKEQLDQEKTKIKQLYSYVAQPAKTQVATPKQANHEQFGRIIDVPLDQKQSPTATDEPLEPVNKKCYNEQYWIHIREQAQSQIKRFKQEKQLQEFSKKSIKNNIERSMSAKNEAPVFQEQSNNSQNQTAQPSSIESEEKSEASEEDKLLDKKKMQLAKMISDHNRRVMPKRPPLPIISPPKPLYALPTFNYLEIYPTFNHIFSVMYTKAQHQALQDIPMIMRDLTNMFTTHTQHFKDRNSYFKPAVFLPFDTSNNFQLTDPKQLLLHAENTYINLKKIVERLEIFNGNLHGQFNEADNRYYRVVKTKQEVYDIISTGFLRRKGWKELPHGCSLRSSWNLFWSWSKPDIDISKLLVWQRINHFPFNKNLSRKDLLYKNLDSFRKMLKIPFNFLPLTYNLPKQFTQFSIKFHEQEIVNRDLNYWIMKPIGKSRGRGIKVINNLAQLNYTDNIIVQKYIINPLLLDGYKFDMRIYVLVTNFHPLEAFVYKEGFARLSTEKFSLEPMFIKNTFVHLTNFAINRNNQDAKQSAAFSGGSKISLKVLKDKVTKMGYSFNNIWSQVHQIIIKSLLGCSISVPPFPTAFQLFGYDIMVDTEGSCHLIEINASPSLERSYMIDEIVKQSLIDDILDIVDPPNFDKEQLLDIMGERLSGKKKVTPEEDLIAIARVLKYKPLRKFGEIPDNIGLFEMIAPSKLSTDFERQIKGRSGANNPKNID